jgi:hypothetical protein
MDRMANNAAVDPEELYFGEERLKSSTPRSAGVKQAQAETVVRQSQRAIFGS